MPKAKQPTAVGIFRDPESLVHAGETARRRGFRDLDAITPYPVHGLAEALGLKVSWMPRVTKTCFFVGAGLGYSFEYWTMAIAWPLNIAGKPFNSVPAFMPVTFECGILLAGICTFLAVLAAGRLRPSPNFKPIDPRLTNDHFALLIPHGVEGGAAAHALLRQAHALEVFDVDR